MINDRLVIKDKLGKGRSSVFLCSDSDNADRELAIKILSSNVDNEEKLTFEKEFITLYRFDHPNIVKVNDFGTIVKKDENDNEIEIGSKYFTLEYFNGTDLLKYENLNNEEKLRKILTQICSAIYYLHQSNYIYYDLKPENILVSEINGEPVVKLIDFGFVHKVDEGQNKSIKGTAEYIAPELLKNESHDFRVDLYSLGIILYQIIYEKFPFERNDELSIYKAHLEQEFEFVKTNYSDQLVDITKRLLQKDPDERYQNVLKILFDLNGSIDNSLSKQWYPAKTFADRSDAINILDAYIKDTGSLEVFTIKGFEGSGKTSLANELYYSYPNAVLIKNERNKSGFKYLLKNIFFSEFVYSKLNEDTRNRTEKILKKPGNELINDIKGVLNKITQECSFILILDDFNRYDDFTFEILKDIIPIFQANKKKVILTEESDFDYKSNFIFNLREISLPPFSEEQVDGFLVKSFHDSFPKNELKKIILLYADLLPGNIYDFMKDILQLQIIKFSNEAVKIDVPDNLERILKSSHDKIYELRLESLNEKEKHAVNLLSLFGISIDKNILALLLEEPDQNNKIILEQLKNNNIINITNYSLQFTSESLKKYVYSKIENKKELHLFTGERLRRSLPNYDRNELARQFELAENYETSYEILKEEIKSTEKISAYSYQKKLLQHLLTLPSASKDEILIDLINVLYKLSDYKTAIEYLSELSFESLNPDVLNDILIIKGSCLIEIGEKEKGKQLLNSVLERLNDKSKKQRLLVEISYSEFDLNNFEAAEKIAENIINNNHSSQEEKGKSYNLLGMTEIFRNNDIDKALIYFDNALRSYKEGSLSRRIAGMEVNLGNIYNIKSKYDKALLHWDKALELNNSIGNLEQEAKILLNYGIYFYNKDDFPKALEYYNRSRNIFISFGDINGVGLVLSNLAESYLPICEYQKCLEVLSESINIFKQLQNNEELAEALFLLAKLYYVLGNISKLGSIIEEYKNILTNNLLAEKHQNNIELLDIFYLMLKGQSDNITDRLTIVKDEYLVLEDRYHFAAVSLILSEKLIRIKRYDEALQRLNNHEFIQISGNNLFGLERNFLLVLIFKYNKKYEIENTLELLKKTYDQLKDESITELTWKVLFELADIYFERGNTKKAIEYSAYSKALIFFIADNIEDQSLRESYLNSFERKKAVERLNLIESNL